MAGFFAHCPRAAALLAVFGVVFGHLGVMSYAGEAAGDIGTWQEAVKFLREKKVSIAFPRKGDRLDLEYYRLPSSRSEIVLVGDRVAKMDDDDLDLVLRFFPAVEDLRLCGEGITDSGLLQLPALKRLKSLEIKHTGATARGYAVLPKLPALKHLTLHNWRTIDAAMASLRQLNDLETLDISGNDLRADDLEAIGHCKSLKELNIKHNWIADEGLNAIAGLVRLERLNLEFCRITGKGLDRLSTLWELKELNLYHNEITDAELDNFPRLPRLETLNLGGNKLEGRGLGHVRRAAPNLKFVALSGNPFSRDAVSELEHLATLIGSGLYLQGPSKLTLGDIARIAPGNVVSVHVRPGGSRDYGEDVKFRITTRRPDGSRWRCDYHCKFRDELMQAVGRYKEVERIDMENLPIGDEAVLPLAGLNKLKTLKISTTSRLTEKILPVINSLPSLQQLDVQGIRFEGRERCRFAKNAQLHSITLANGQISEDVLAGIADCPADKTLSLSRVAFSGNALRHLGRMRRLIWLKLPSIDLTGQDLTALGKLPNVESLNLSGTSLDNQQMACLAGMKNLKTIDIQNTRVSKDGLLSLRTLPAMNYVFHKGSRISDAQQIADLTGWTFAGPCSCGCMDIEPRKKP